MSLIMNSKLDKIINVEIKYYKARQKLLHAHRMATYKLNTTRWKIKNDLDVWERKEKYYASKHYFNDK